MKSVHFILLAAPLAAQVPAPAPVVTHTVAAAAPWEKTITLPAEAVANFRVTLGTPATGWIATVKADVGSRVKAGEVLAEIRAPELVAARDARLEEARAAKQKIAQAASMHRSAEATAAAAKSEFDRIEQLVRSGTVTSKARDEAEARLAAATAMVGEAEAGMAAAEADALAAAARATEAEAALEYTRITAPFDGLVVARNAELGDFLGPASVREKLFVFEQTDPLRVRIQIPEHAAALADAGDAVTLRLGGQEFTSKLLRVSSSLDPVTRTMTAEAEISGSKLIPGTFGTATVKAAKLDSAILIPLKALRTDPDGSRYVLVLDGDQQRKVPATFFATDGTQAILTTGPAAGDKVVLP
jgi:RND family efflux transporter MFP subunit